MDGTGKHDGNGGCWTDKSDGWDVKSALVVLNGWWTDKMDGYIE